MSNRVRLFLLSFVMLFVELALIRWTGSNVVYLSYFSNFVLLGSFLGIGVGFLRAGARVNLWPWSPLVLTLLVAFVLFFPVKIDRSGNELLYFGEYTSTGLPRFITLPVIFLAVALVMAMIAEGVARVFKEFEPLEAYRLDILGAIAGIVCFSLLSFASAPPVLWGAAVAATMGLLLAREHRLALLPLIALVALLGWETLQPNLSWSPYYKVAVEAQGPGSYRIDVNGIPHQAINTVDARRASEPIYFLPYERAATPIEDVLVVGAGNGTDVAIALAHGVAHVDAVEIDPRLADIGRELHPNHPYPDERVDLFIDDGRAFLERTDERYDLILFALPDSLTLVSGQSSLRLESYLFTRQAMEEAKRHLSRNGVFAMYNYYREGWLVDRLARTLAEAYGHPPCLDKVEAVGGLAMLTISPNADAVECPTRWSANASAAPVPATDDYPFLYLREPTIPDFYLLTIGLILAASIVIVRAAAGALSQMAPYLDLFFMGAAFLLLETKNVVQFALLFGTTWFVNALVFTGILLAVLAAVEAAKRFTIKPSLLYTLLFASIAISLLVPANALLPLPLALRFVAAIVLAFTPIFLANLLFAERFKEVGTATTAFGANLLGAMIGGLLEYSSLLVGYRALLLLVALLYALAYLFGRRYARFA